LRRFGTRAGLLAVAAGLLGILGGLGIFTFTYGEGASYLSSNPDACVNCHVMRDQYASWSASSHSAQAACVDCHLPHGPVSKWLAKAENGWFHSVAFTLQNFPEPIRIKPRNRAIVQRNCVSCHTAMVHEMLPTTSTGESVQCMHCHQDVGHAAWR
jgi:cytochrome c nitrite reductase small subunit